MMRNIIIVNLGSPARPDAEAVGEYLKEFLMDPNVLDMPAVYRWILVNLLIVPKRKFNSAEAYKKVWTSKGSPLIVNTENFASKLRGIRPQWDVRVAMRYGKNNLKTVLTDFLKETSEPIEMIPLYPQYAKSSTGTCLDIALKTARDLKLEDRVKFLPEFYRRPEFIKSFGQQLKESLKSFAPDKLLFSFHGLPEHHIKELDRTDSYCLKTKNCCDQILQTNRKCYRAQCFHTAKGIAGDVGVNPVDYVVSFQSRLGRKPWIKPYTDVVLRELATSGAKKLLVVCPSFVSDCLETLEEIEIRAKEDFISYGGEDLKLVASLNDSAVWVEAFAAMLEDRSLNWEDIKVWKRP